MNQYHHEPDCSSYTRLQTGMEYIRLPKHVPEIEIRAFCERMRRHYSNLANDWNIETNSEWIIRHYLALKLILSVTLMLSALEYSERKNLKIVEPYLLYYAGFNCCRALILTLPDHPWQGGKLFRMNHTKVLNVTSDAMRQVSSSLGQETKTIMTKAKVYRELFSYRFPASGPGFLDPSTIVSLDEVERLCRLLSEVAQLNSEVLQEVLEKRGLTQVGIAPSILNEGFTFESGARMARDNEDLYRVDYFIRKQPFPVSIYSTAREGLVEDFFGAWEDKERPDDDELYNARPWDILLSPL